MASKQVQHKGWSFRHSVKALYLTTWNNSFYLFRLNKDISWSWFFPGVSISRYIFHEGKFAYTDWGYIVETEGRIWKMQKRVFFHYEKRLKGAFLIWPMDPLYIFLSKKFFEKNNKSSSRAASGSWTQS